MNREDEADRLNGHWLVSRLDIFLTEHVGMAKPPSQTRNGPRFQFGGKNEFVDPTSTTRSPSSNGVTLIRHLLKPIDSAEPIGCVIKCAAVRKPHV